MNYLTDGELDMGLNEKINVGALLAVGSPVGC
jgi:hypothetical protein